MCLLLIFFYFQANGSVGCHHPPPSVQRNHSTRIQRPKSEDRVNQTDGHNHHPHRAHHTPAPYSSQTLPNPNHVNNRFQLSPQPRHRRPDGPGRPMTKPPSVPPPPPPARPSAQPPPPPRQPPPPPPHREPPPPVPRNAKPEVRYCSYIFINT